jgi:tetratricopeptide (TPR) repeat protein
MRFALAVFGAGVIAWSQDTQALSHARQSHQLSQQGKLAEAEQEIRESLRLEPANPLYHSALAGLLQKCDRLEESRSELEKAMDLKPSDAVREQLTGRLERVDLELGARLAKSGRYHAGLVVATDAARLSPNSAAALQMLGFFQTKRSLNLDAVNSYRRALEIDPASTEASVGLGVAQSAAGMPAEALQTLEAGARRFPRDAMHWQAIGLVLLQLAELGNCDPTRAQAAFDTALKINPDLAESHYRLGSIALENGDLTSARDHLEKALGSTPAGSRVHFALARLYRRENHPAEAAREMEAFERAKAAEQLARVSALGSSAP